MSQLLQTLINESPVVVFAWVHCPYCTNAKKLLGTLTSEMKVHNVDSMENGKAIHNAIIESTHHETVPAIYIRQQFVGGFSDIDALHRAGKLVPMINGGKL